MLVGYLELNPIKKDGVCAVFFIRFKGGVGVSFTVLRFWILGLGCGVFWAGFGYFLFVIVGLFGFKDKV